MIEHPTENIEDVSMTISHIKTPKKVSDMKSYKPSIISKSTKKKTQKLIQSEAKHLYGKGNVSSKKETKYMAISLSNERFNDKNIKES